MLFSLIILVPKEEDVIKYGYLKASLNQAINHVTP